MLPLLGMLSDLLPSDTLEWKIDILGKGAQYTEGKMWQVGRSLTSQRPLSFHCLSGLMSRNVMKGVMLTHLHFSVTVTLWLAGPSARAGNRRRC
jgi:hypothetical protein